MVCGLGPLLPAEAATNTPAARCRRRPGSARHGVDHRRWRSDHVDHVRGGSVDGRDERVEGAGAQVLQAAGIEIRRHAGLVRNYVGVRRDAGDARRAERRGRRVERGVDDVAGDRARGVAAVTDVVIDADAGEVVLADELVVAAGAGSGHRRAGAHAVEAAAWVGVDVAVDRTGVGEGGVADVDAGVDDAGDDPLALRAHAADGAGPRCRPRSSTADRHRSGRGLVR
jgi:hypothetical protein